MSDKITHMHALPPPKNVILIIWSKYDNQDLFHTAYRFEYTPGMCASVRACGNGFNHLSGFHSYESGPHSSGLQLEAMMPTTTFVLLGIGISCISFPSSPLIGFESGMTVSFLVLIELK